MTIDQDFKLYMLLKKNFLVDVANGDDILSKLEMLNYQMREFPLS